MQRVPHSVRFLFVVCVFVLAVMVQANASDVQHFVEAKSTRSIRSHEKAQSFGELMIVFIRSILEEEPKPIDESLIRDDE